ncbi:DNA-binding protein [Boudabousia liubingyangii]|uniref:DNA-binding protein n=1 Tax=Boudabousia liubingyangii TaxID=1921764 RepID=A0A1Q5PKW6_9ACTO|nr:helix-turn-helix domain-containing protein [Boudabousia liubingyangii]OKL46402.1 DNA-binding protein [Boudabousia liubingyangii]OKL47276.1 DNA-binding protein [Boudabousia liubingyangii]
MPRFLTLADVSEQLNLTPAATRALITSGDLPAIQVGPRKLWRIEESELEAYIQRLYQENEQRISALNSSHQ